LARGGIRSSAKVCSRQVVVPLSHRGLVAEQLFHKMICVLSPAKAMDLSGGPNHGVMSQPVMKDTGELLNVCKKLSASDMKKLMGVSDAIAAKDVERYQNWEKNQSKAVCLAMDGPAYRGFDGSSLSPAERKVAQKQVRVLSGLYGVLKPFDAIRPYRLEMGSKLQTSRGKDLYSFWSQSKMVEELAKDAKVIVNAASQEYWKAVLPKGGDTVLDRPLITVDFPGPSVYAKKARGLICRYIVQHKCQKPEDLKGFQGAPGDSYVFDPSKSTQTKYSFKRVAGAKAGAPPAKANGLKRAASSTQAAAAKKARKV